MKKHKIIFLIYLLLVSQWATFSSARAAEIQPFNVELNEANSVSLFEDEIETETTNTSKKLTSEKYTEFDFVEGLDPDLSLYVNTNDLLIDFSSTQDTRIRMRTDVDHLFEKGSYPNTIRVEAYEYDNEGNKVFISTVRPTIFNKKLADNLEFDINLGHFDIDYKEVYIDLYDGQEKLLNTYKYEIEARNITAQSNELQSTTLDAADCETFDDCLFKYFFENVNIQAVPKVKLSTEVSKLPDGKYLVTIPLAKRRVNVKRGKNVKDQNTNTGEGELGAAGYLGSIASKIELGISDDQKGTLSYDPNENTLSITFDGGNSVVFDDQGRLGVGVEKPLAYVDVAGSTDDIPSIRINDAKNLTDEAIEGTIEFSDGQFYITYGGKRRVLNAITNSDGIIDESAYSDKVVITDKPQAILNKTIADTVLTGDISFVPGAPAGYVISSMNANGRFAWQQIATFTNGSVAGNGALAVGLYVSTNGDNSIVMGAGNSSSDYLINDVDNSLMVGFQSNAATLFVGTSNGGSTHGNVGIGTENPRSKLHVNGSLQITDGTEILFHILQSDANGRAKWVDISSALENGGATLDSFDGFVQDVNGNTFTGNGAGLKLWSALFNTGIGYKNSQHITNGDENVSVGAFSLNGNVTGNGNIAIGYRAGDNITSGNGNIIIGHNIDAQSSTGSNQLNIGNTIFGDLSLQRLSVGALTPEASLEVGDGTANFIDGTDDLLVADDIEADGDAWIAGDLTAGNINGTSLDLDFLNGSVIFADANGSLTEDNNNFFYDDANERLGLGTRNPSSKLHLYSASTSEITVENTANNHASIYFDADRNAGDYLTYIQSRWNSTAVAGLAFQAGTDAKESGHITFSTRAPSDTSLVERMRISQNGIVAIGTNTPLNNFIMDSNGDVGPHRDGVYDLGSATRKWSNIHVNIVNATTLSTSLNTGSIVFANASGELSEDNANFFWDDTNNRIGINTTTPQGSLHVAKEETRQILLNRTEIGETNTDGTYFSAGGGGLFTIWNQENEDIQIGTNGVEVLRLTNNGRVGINDATPDASLDIVSISNGKPIIIAQAANNQTGNLSEWRDNGGTILTNIDSSGNLNFSSDRQINTSGDLDILLGDQNNDEITFNASGSQALQIIRGSRVHTSGGTMALTGGAVGTNLDLITKSRTSGSGGVGDIRLLAADSTDGTARAGDIALQAGQNSADQDEHGIITMSTGGLTRVTVTGNGNVGINFSNPSRATLEVNGQALISGGSPSKDYVLTAVDSNGLAQWKDISYVLTNGGAFINALNDAISDQSSNLFMGNGAGLDHTGAENTGVGINTLRTMRLGNGNTAFGFEALSSLTNGDYNIAIGEEAGKGVTSGNGNIFIGYDANGSSATPYNELNIGNTIYGDLNNGNVGIGIENPDARLRVDLGSDGTSLKLSGNNNHANTVLQVMHYTGTPGEVRYSATGNTKQTFRTQNIERLVIDNGGNIGIGDSSPDNFELEVNGNIGPNTDSTHDLGSSTIRWANIYSDAIDSTVVNGGTFDGDFTNGSILFSNQVGVISQDNSNFYWDRQNNRLGIGTNSPSSDIHISHATDNLEIRLTKGAGTATIRNDNNLDIDSPANGPGAGALQISGHNNSTIGTDAGSIRVYASQVNPNGFVTLETAGAERMRVDNSGNVGIGYTAPDRALLEINGQALISGGSPSKDYVLTAVDSNGLAIWKDISYVLTNGGAFINALNDAISDQSSNLFMGNGAGLDHTGAENTGVGINALRTMRLGNGNTVFGFEALSSLTNGDYNIAIGEEAGKGVTSGNGNIFIGYDVNGSSATPHNELNIGNTIYGDLNNGDIAIGTETKDGALVVNQTNAADIFNLQDGGTTVFTVEDGGDVGIGLADPVQPLHISDSSAPAQAKFTNNTIGNTLADGFSIGLQSSSSANAEVWNYEAGYIRFGTSNNERARLDSAGNLGIGENNPQAMLSVNGDAIFNESGGDNDFRIEGDTEANLFFADASTDRVGIGTSTPDATLQVNGAVQFGDQSSTNYSTFNIGQVALTTADSNRGLVITGAANAGSAAIIRPGNASNSAFTIQSSSSADMFVVRSAGDTYMGLQGNVGLGFTNPSRAKLEINGQLLVDSSNATKDYVLTSVDGNGLAQWKDISYVLTNGGAFINALNDAISDQSSNLFMGNGAGLDHTGAENTGVGINALRTMRIGNGNTAFGYEALSSLTNGDYNIAIGEEAGKGVTSGNGNIFIGYDVNGSSLTPYNELNIGNTIYGDLNNGEVSIGTQTPNSQLDISTGAGGGDTNESRGIRLTQTGTGGTGLYYFTSTSTLEGGLYKDTSQEMRLFGNSLRFLTNATPDKDQNNDIRMTINSTGLVGIGEGSPDAMLEIATSSTGEEGLHLKAIANQTADLFRITDSSDTDWVTIGVNGTTVFNEAGLTSADLRIEGATETNLFFAEASTDRVGIGTNDPRKRLDVVDSSASSLTYPLKVQNLTDSLGNSGAGILFNSGHAADPGRGKGALAYIYDAGWNKGSFHFLQDQNNDTSNPTLADSVMVIKNTGNVGMGYINATRARLEINGQLLVDSTNATKDYVLTSVDGNGLAQWKDISYVLNNGGAFLNALNDAISDANSNLFLGNGAGLDHTGKENTGIGINALTTMRIGNGNTALGYSALNSLTNGDFNIAIGEEAGKGTVSGNGNIFIGYDVNGSSTTPHNELNIGNTIFGDLNNGNVGIGTQTPNSKLELGSGQFLLPNGSAGAPAIAFSNDTDTGLYWTGAAQLNLGVSGGARIIVEPNGTRVQNDLRMQNNETLIFYRDNGSSDPITFIPSGVGASRVLGIIGGNVGIGYTSPSSKLAVNGDLFVNGTVNGTSFDGDFTNGSILFSNQDGVISEDNSRFYWDRQNNRLGINTNSPSRELTVNGNQFFLGDSRQIYFGGNNTFIGERSNTTELQLRGGGSNGFNTVYINTQGNLGVGISTVTARLHANINDASHKGLIINAASNQTANLTEWQNGGGTVMSLIDNMGNMSISSNLAPDAALEVGNGVLTYIDGANDVLIQDDLEVDDTIWTEVINGTTAYFDTLYATIFAGSLTLDNGTAARPSHSFTHDNGTGMYLDANGRLAFSTTETERLLIDGNGYVGINQSYPGAMLTVNGSATFNESGRDNDLRVEGDTNQNLFFVDASTDRVGIGTNTPGSTFDVSGSVTVSGSYNSRFYVDNNRFYHSNNNSYVQFGSASIREQNNTDIEIRPGGGNVGINFTSPSRAKLEVNGQALISGGSPSKDYVLTSVDSNGLAIWKDISYVLSNGGAFINALNDAISDQSSNLFIGNGAGLDHTGAENTGVGINALRTTRLGNGNTAFGYEALSSLTNGDYNIAIGEEAGKGITSGNGNIFIGYDVNGSSLTPHNELNIGNTIYGDLANGEISIGIQTPANTLHVEKQVNSGVLVEFDNTSTTGTGVLALNTGNNGQDVLLIQRNGSNVGKFNNDNSFLNLDADTLQFRTLAGSNIMDLTLDSNWAEFTVDATNGFRVESDFYITAAGKVGINESASDAMLEIATDATTEEGLHIKASAGQTANLFRITDPSDTDWVTIGVNGNTAFNEAGLPSADFRIEGDTTDDLFMADASTNRIGIGVTSPDSLLEVGNGTATYIDGTNDVLIQDDLEVDDTIWASTVNGTTGLFDTLYATIFAGSLTLDNGTAARPSHSFTHDNGSGMYLDANGRLAFSTTETERLLIDVDGDIGIGTSTPSYDLHTVGDIYASNALRSGSFVLAGTGTISPNIGSGLYASNALVYNSFRVNQVLSNDNYIEITQSNGKGIINGSANGLELQSGGTNRLRIISDGNVGIGDPDPDALLEVGNGAVTYIDGTNDVLIADDLEVDDTIWTGTINGDLAYFDTLYATIFAGSLALDNGTAARPSHSFTHDNGSGMYLDANGRLAFSTTETQRLLITADGNVGIGTSSPRQKLDVIGTIESRAMTVNGNSSADLNLYGHDGSKTSNIKVRRNGAAWYVMAYDDTSKALAFRHGDGGTQFLNSASQTSMIINNSHNVGIRETSPSAQLAVNGSAIFNESGGDNDFRIEGDTTDDLFLADASTNRIGIGVTSPDSLLEVGNGTVTYIDGTNDVLIQDDLEVDDTIWAGTVNGDLAYFDTLYATIFAGSLALDNGTAARPSHGFTHDNGTGMYLVSNGKLAFSTTEAQRLLIDGNGNIGISISTPNERLTINGNLSLANQSSAPSNTEGFGKVFVNGNELYFLDNGDNITALTGPLAGQWVYNSGTLHPKNDSANDDIVVGGTTTGGADIILNSDGSAVFNEQSNSVDLRIEGNSDANLFFVDGSTDSIGIGYANPSRAKLEINGGLLVNTGTPSKDKVLASVDGNGLVGWLDISTVLTNGGAFLDSMNDAVSDANSNLFLGNGAGLDHTGKENTGVGINALTTMRIGNGNTAYGYSALSSLTNGDYNIAIGEEAGKGITSGNGNIFIGYDVNGSSLTPYNELNIGNTIYGDLANGNVGIGTQTPSASLEIGTGQIFTPTGSAAAPSYSFSGDGDTGMYRPGANQLAFTNAGSMTLRIDSGGKLNLVGTGSTTDPILSWASDTNTGLSKPAADSLSFITGGAEAVKIDSAQNVGIGYTSPSAKLAVNGDLLVDTVNGSSFDGDFTNGSVLFSNAAGVISEDNTSFYWDKDNNRLGVGTNSPTSTLEVGTGVLTVPVGAAATPSVTFSGDTDTGIHRVSANKLGLAAGANTTMTVTSSYVGVKTSFPQGSFHVVDSNANDKTLIVQKTHASPTDAAIVVQDANAVDHIKLGPFGGAIFNENGDAHDFRIEGDTDVNGFFLDASTDRIGLGTSTPQQKLDIRNGVIYINQDGTAPATSVNRTLNVTDDTTPQILIARSDSTTGASESLGEILFDSYDSSSVSSVDASVALKAFASENHSNLAKGGIFTISTKEAATDYDEAATERFRINENGQVGISHANPNELLTINGNVSIANQSSAPSATEGFGKVFVNGNELYFLDNGGTQTALSGPQAGQWTYNSGTLHPKNDSDNDDIAIGGTTVGAADIVLNSDGSAVFNEQGAAVDFRIEGDTEANLLFVDGSTDRIGIGTNTPGAATVEIISGGATEDVLSLSRSSTNTSVPSGDYNTLSLVNTDTTANNFVKLGFIDSTGGTNSAAILGIFTDHGNDYGEIAFATRDAGGFRERARVTEDGNFGIGRDDPAAMLAVNGSAIFNESGGDNDLRIEGDTLTNLFFVDASTDTVGINDSTPDAMLDIVTDNVAEQGLIVQAKNGQTANLAEFQNGGGLVLSLIDNKGWMTIGNSASPDATLEVGNGTIASSGVDGIDDLIVADDVEINGDLWIDGTLHGAHINGSNLEFGVTAGSVLFGNGGEHIVEDNANFFWDDTNNRLGIGTNSPATDLHVEDGTFRTRRSSDSDYIQISSSGLPSLQFVNSGVASSRFRFNGNTLTLDQQSQFDIYSTTRVTSDGGTSAEFRVQETNGVVQHAVSLYANNDYAEIEAWRVGNDYNLPLVLQRRGQNVGIKETAPAALLAVNGSAIFNESGGSNDFRIEGDTVTSLFFVDGSADRVGIGLNAPTDMLHIHGNGTASYTHYTHDVSGKTSSDGLHVGLGSGSNHAYIWQRENAQILIGANNSEIARFSSTNFNVTSSGGTSHHLFSNTGSATFNEQGANADFRVEGDTDANVLVVDASADSVGVGTNTPNSTLQVSGSLALPLTTKTNADSPYSAAATDHTILCNATAGAITVNLPAASGLAGRIYIIKKTDSSSNGITIDANAAETIDGATTQVLNAQYESITVQTDGSNWFIL